MSLGWEDPLEKGKATHSSSLVAKSQSRLLGVGEGFQGGMHSSVPQFLCAQLRLLWWLNLPLQLPSSEVGRIIRVHPSPGSPPKLKQSQ